MSVATPTAVMTNSGVHALPSEFAELAALAQQLETTKSRVVRAAIALAGEAGEQELRVAISGLEPLHGRGLQSGVFLSAVELAALDRLAELAGESRSRLARAALRLLVDAGAGQQGRLLASLPQDGRRRTRCASTRSETRLRLASPKDEESSLVSRRERPQRPRT